jgi:hypothetical protein
MEDKIIRYCWNMLPTKPDRAVCIMLTWLHNASIDDFFEALVVQRGRLKDMQQLREW